MNLTPLTAVSPIDGRYGNKTDSLRAVFSEHGLIQRRVLVEVRWLQQLATLPGIPEVPALSNAANAYLENLLENFSVQDSQRIKDILLHVKTPNIHGGRPRHLDPLADHSHNVVSGAVVF